MRTKKDRQPGAICFRSAAAKAKSNAASCRPATTSSAMTAKAPAASVTTSPSVRCTFEVGRVGRGRSSRSRPRAAPCTARPGGRPPAPRPGGRDQQKCGANEQQRVRRKKVSSQLKRPDQPRWPSVAPFLRQARDSSTFRCLLAPACHCRVKQGPGLGSQNASGSVDADEPTSSHRLMTSRTS
jgi:hypothetical protein